MHGHAAVLLGIAAAGAGLASASFTENDFVARDVLDEELELEIDNYRRGFFGGDPDPQSNRKGGFLTASNFLLSRSSLGVDDENVVKNYKRGVFGGDSEPPARPKGGFLAGPDQSGTYPGPGPAPEPPQGYGQDSVAPAPSPQGYDLPPPSTGYAIQDAPEQSPPRSRGGRGRGRGGRLRGVVTDTLRAGAQSATDTLKSSAKSAAKEGAKSLFRAAASRLHRRDEIERRMALPASDCGHICGAFCGHGPLKTMGCNSSGGKALDISIPVTTIPRRDLAEIERRMALPASQCGHICSAKCGHQAYDMSGCNSTGGKASEISLSLPMLGRRDVTGLEARESIDDEDLLEILARDLVERDLEGSSDADDAFAVYARNIWADEMLDDEDW